MTLPSEHRHMMRGDECLICDVHFFALLNKTQAPYIGMNYGLLGSRRIMIHMPVNKPEDSIVKIAINEIFYSLQGEGRRAGRPTVFVRTQICDLRCTWCDTKDSWTGKKLVMTTQEVFEEIIRHPTRSVCFTGGEPLIQERQLADLAVRLLLHDPAYDIHVETGGHKPIPVGMPWNRCSFVMDWKCPDSGMNMHMIENNLHMLRDSDELKFVIESAKDWIEAQRTIAKMDKGSVLISPVWNKNTDLEQYVDRTMDLKKLYPERDIRFQVQLHKIIWGSKRGV